MGVSVARGLIGEVGVALVALGMALLVIGGPGADLFTVMFMVVPGILVTGAVLVERVRYRSLHAERTGAAPGAGGGETVHPEPRFRPTGEIFVDPTTHVRLRVWADQSTGERLYVPEA